MIRRLWFGDVRPFDAQTEIDTERARQADDDGWHDLNAMTEFGITAEELTVMRGEHYRRTVVPTPRRQRTKLKPATPTAPQGTTVKAVAARLETTDDHVLSLIRSGRLRAVNIGRGVKKPRWRIPPDALHEFMRGRAAPRSGERKRRKKGARVTEFFSELNLKTVK